MKLVWTNSGDYIDCVPVDQAFAEYWLDNQKTIQYKSITENNQLKLCTELTETYARIKLLLDKVKLSIYDIEPSGLIQKDINELHRNWVLLHTKYPKIKLMFGKQFEQDVELLNKLLHEIEKAWATKLKADDAAFVNNHLIPITFGDANIKILYANLGRSTYNKWLNFDYDMGNVDTNDYEELYPLLEFKVAKHYNVDPPKEYQQWCERQGVRPTPDDILLANFKDLSDNLDTYRTLFMKNFVLSNNDVIFIQ